MKARKNTNVVDANLRKKMVASLTESGLSKAIATTYEKDINDRASTKEEYINTMYEKVGELRSSKDMSNVPSSANVGWESPFYNKERERYENAIIQANTKIKPIKGIYVCKNKKCLGDEFYIWREQRASQDEGMTVIRQCSKCLTRGTER